MKRMLVLCLLAGSIGAPTATLATGEKWTKPQQEVADVFATWAATELAGDVERQMSLLAPTFTAWDFAQPAPLDRAAYRQLTVDLFKQARVVEMAITPIAIQVDRRTAVAHGRYAQTFQDPAGAKKSVQGPWTASLIRDGNKWLVLGIGWMEDRPATDEAAIREEVHQTMQAFLAACERVDVEEAWKFQATTPDYCYVDIHGTPNDATGARKSWSDFFASCAATTHQTKREDIVVFGPDTALLTWQGSAECVMKNGSTLRFDPTSSTALFRRTDGAWKIAYLQDSSARPQATRPATTPEMPAVQPGEIAAKLTYAFNQHDAAAVARLYAEDQSTVLPGHAEPVRGRQAKEEMVAGYFRAFPDLRIDTPVVVVTGNSIICSGTITGTNTGPLASPEGDQPPTGRIISLPISYILTVGPDGLVHTDHTYFDPASFQQQLAADTNN